MKKIKDNLGISLLLGLACTGMGYAGASEQVSHQSKDGAESYRIAKFADTYSAVIRRSTELDPEIKQQYEEVEEEVTEPFGYDIVIYKAGRSKPVLVQRNSGIGQYDLNEVDDNGNIIPNIKELPYGHQSVLMYDDVNFDGREDFILKDGNMSCYGGPSYRVYLANKQGTFTESDAFTSLAQDYCGMFHVNDEKKQLETMTKSGAAWHQFRKFAVKNNEPWLIHDIEIGSDANYLFETVRRFPKPNQPYKTDAEGEVLPVSTKTRYFFRPPSEDEYAVFSFRLKKQPQKLALIYAYESGHINYTLLDTSKKDAPYEGGDESQVEFDAFLSFMGKYPYYKRTVERHEAYYEKHDDWLEPDFKRVSKNQLRFNNKGTYYTFVDLPNSQQKNRFGIRVKAGGKTYFIEGDKRTRKGSLQQVMTRWRQSN